MILAPQPNKVYNVQQNIGRAKYVINYHGGIKKHPDGSPFFDIATFSKKKSWKSFEKQLLSEGYQYKF